MSDPPRTPRRPNRTTVSGDVFDDEDGDVIFGIVVSAKGLEERVDKFVSLQGVGQISEECNDLVYSDVERSVSPFDKAVGEHDELGARRNCDGLGDATAGGNADDRSVGCVECSNLTVRESQDEWRVAGRCVGDGRGTDVHDGESGGCQEQSGALA